jgi:hypothetical protein
MRQLHTQDTYKNTSKSLVRVNHVLSLHTIELLPKTDQEQIFEAVLDYGSPVTVQQASVLLGHAVTSEEIKYH